MLKKLNVRRRLRRRPDLKEGDPDWSTRCQVCDGRPTPASDWLVWAVLLGRQFYGRWKLVREQGLHWVPDVMFREDDSRVRDRIAARNLAILRKIAINLMSRDRTTRAACGPVASRPPGMTITCSLFWLDDFMRRP